MLVVSDDLGLSDDVGAGLEGARLDVLICPGPGTGGCIGLSGQQCALERAADAVVLDLHPTGDSLVDASRRTELARYYSDSDTTVLVLADDIGHVQQTGMIGVANLGRFAGRHQIAETVQELMTQRRWPPQHTSKES